VGVRWLQSRVPRFRDLSQVELEAVSDFTLLWSLFEARVLDQRASASSISEAVDRWGLEGALADDPYDDVFAYFQQRYFVNGHFTAHFAALRLRANDREPQVRAALDGTDVSSIARASAVFVIVYRFRNNLFHGGKWDYGLADQLDNFLSANEALKLALDRHGGLGNGLQPA